jgi:hypothetical protein
MRGGGRRDLLPVGGREREVGDEVLVRHVDGEAAEACALRVAEEARQVRQLVAQKLSQSEIARRLSIGRTSVRRILDARRAGKKRSA